MKSFIKLFISIVIMLALTACAAKQRYEWSGYDKKLYSHYKDPSQKDEFIQALKETIDDATPDGRVPPGIFAEYGFVLYEQGNSLEAVQYYQKEADKWPESRPFMAKMINIAQKRIKKQDDKQIKETVPVTEPKQSLAEPAGVPK
jgi:hypothetical protein